MFTEILPVAWGWLLPELGATLEDEIWEWFTQQGNWMIYPPAQEGVWPGALMQSTSGGNPDLPPPHVGLSPFQPSWQSLLVHPNMAENGYASHTLWLSTNLRGGMFRNALKTGKSIEKDNAIDLSDADNAYVRTSGASSSSVTNTD